MTVAIENHAEAARAAVESIRFRLESLVAERQRLRAEGADPEALEHNRRAIVDGQWQLAGALIACYV